MQAPTVEAAIIDMKKVLPGPAGADPAESQWDHIEPIATACEAPPVLPDQFTYFVEENGQDAKPVALVRTEHLSGIVFFYLSRGEEEVMTGLAGALVEYEADGTHGRIYKATELLGYEGWVRWTSSTVSSISVERCDQELEYFKYSNDGDIVGHLVEPIRSPRFCEDILLFTSPRGD